MTLKTDEPSSSLPRHGPNCLRLNHPEKMQTPVKRDRGREPTNKAYERKVFPCFVNENPFQTENSTNGFQLLKQSQILHYSRLFSLEIDSCWYVEGSNLLFWLLSSVYIAMSRYGSKRGKESCERYRWNFPTFHIALRFLRSKERWFHRNRDRDRKSKADEWR